jgi:hypothetical protein
MILPSTLESLTEAAPMLKMMIDELPELQSIA